MLIGLNIKELIIKERIQGFTLVELIIVVTLSGILSLVVGVFIARPITSYANVTRRAELVEAADLALRRMARDIQQALPNSIRIKGDPSNPQRIAIEMIRVVDGMRYRAYPSAGKIALDFSKPITQFNVIGQFQFAIANPDCLTGNCVGNDTCAAGNCRLVVFNTGANTGGSQPTDNPSPGANVYSTSAAPNCNGCLPPPGSRNVTPQGMIVSLSNPGNEGLVTLSSPFMFGLPSPRQRLYVVDTPITYVCDVGTDQEKITRFWNYSVAENQPVDPSSNPLIIGANAQLTQFIKSCSFSYTPGANQRNGLVTLIITLAKNDENITLMREVNVSNVP